MRHRYPIAQHMVGILPILLLLGAVFLFVGSEDSIEAFFLDLRTRNAVLTEVAAWFSRFGNTLYYLFFFGLLLTGIKARKEDMVSAVITYVIGLSLTLLLANVVKISVGRPRPPVDGECIPLTFLRDNHSFPSGHVAETLATVIPLSRRFGSLMISFLLGFSPVLMGLSRLYLGKHHPSDFLGSILVSGVALFAAWHINQYLLRFRNMKKNPFGDEKTQTAMDMA